MSDINVQNKKSVQNQVQMPKVAPLYPATTVLPCITNNNGFLPTYNPAYYTTHFGYQTPGCQAKYPSTQPTTATISTGGQTYEVKPGPGGVNIILNSPTVAAPGSQPLINTNTNCVGDSGNGCSKSDFCKKYKKTKNIVAITDDYVKNLENYVRNPNKDLKLYGVIELGKRFAEDESRKTNPSLNALLNLALQAREKAVRAVALSLIYTGCAGGNDQTVKLLTNMQQGKAYFGDEANDAKKALLKMSETVVKVPDYSPDKVKHENEGYYYVTK